MCIENKSAFGCFFFIKHFAIWKLFRIFVANHKTMTRTQFKNGINAELKTARISNKVVGVKEDKNLHTILTFKSPITDGQKNYLALRWKCEIKGKTLTIKHPIE